MRARKYFEVDRLVPRVGRIRRNVRTPKERRAANAIIDGMIEVGGFEYLALVQIGQVSIAQMIADDRNKKYVGRSGRLPSSKVYLVRGELTGLYKIGIANDVSRRLAELQSGSPDDLRLVSKIDGGRAVEQQLHRRFAALRVRGEWFRLGVAELEAFRQADTGSIPGDAVSSSGPIRAIEAPAS